ncbi:MAG: DUF3316 domain-containing protein [Paludibacter sp.]|nr:DUF3316 domain-containing protein [Paludibacter sp.]
MKKLISFFILCGLFAHLYARQEISEKYALTGASELYGLSGISIMDPYLSPLQYGGLGLLYEYESHRFINSENTKLSIQTRFNTNIGIAFNSAITSSTYCFGGAYSWGMHYHLDNSFYPSAQFLLGGTADINFLGKLNGRNGNNPYNMDLATNLNLSGIVRYDFELWHKKMRLTYNLEAPFIGCFFAPEAGLSYYEIGEFGVMDNTIHFSSLLNKQGMTGRLMCEIPFRCCTLKFGFISSELKYKANDLLFTTNSFNFMIGYSYKFHTFKGTRETIPAIFTDSEKY